MRFASATLVSGAAVEKLITSPTYMAELAIYGIPVFFSGAGSQNMSSGQRNFFILSCWTEARLDATVRSGITRQDGPKHLFFLREMFYLDSKGGLPTCLSFLTLTATVLFLIVEGKHKKIT